MQTPKLHRRINGWWGSRTKNEEGRFRWFFCADTVAEYFDIPKKAKYIWFVVGLKPNKYRHAVKISCRDFLHIMGRQYDLVPQTANEIELKGLRNTLIYVECHYE